METFCGYMKEGRTKGMDRVYRSLHRELTSLVLQSGVAPVEGRSRRSVPILPPIGLDRLKSAKAMAEKAVKLRKVFSVEGPYPVIRAALWARGWVECGLPPQVQRASHCHGDEEEDGDDADASSDVTERVDGGEKEENLDDTYNLMSRLARNETAYFYWTTRRDCNDRRSLRNDQMTNHFANSGTFTTKVGLCLNLRSLQWFDKADPDTFFPRCYMLGSEDEKQAFIEDFRRTACTSLLQHVVETRRAEVREQKASNSISEKSDNVEHRSVGPESIDTALHVCEEFLSGLEHGDIDVLTPPAVEEQQWAQFLQDYYMVVHEGALIRDSCVFVELCQAMLTRLQAACPQLDTDGLKNIWIIKPGAMSRGRGITCKNRLEEILAHVDTNRVFTRESKWVVQKYLERPLLVHGTKFDLRQWFLVTDWNPLTVWFYSECYLRFSTQPYTTDTLDSSIHLCNNAIQRHFKPSPDRHPGVPPDNMWSCSQFKAFLEQQGCEAHWEMLVVPGMQQAVIHAMQTAQHLVEPRKASFELYGADFMLSQDLRPWLLEINASPTMSCSTAVTARLCPAVQLDTLRVVLDWRSDSSAYTGGFKLIYKQAAVDVPHYVGMNLLVEGTAVRKLGPVLKRQSFISIAPLSTQPPSDHSTPEEAETSHSNPSPQKPHMISSSRRSDKENSAVEEKKRQLTPTSPKRVCEARTDIQNTQNASCVRRSCQSRGSEQPLPVHTKRQRKVQRLSLRLCSNGPTLVPRSLSFSLSPPHSTLHRKSQPTRGHVSRVSRPFLPQTAMEPQLQASARVLPSLQGPLPCLEAFSLRPNIVAGAVGFHNTNSSIHRHHALLRPHRQTRAKYVRDCGGKQ